MDICSVSRFRQSLLDPCAHFTTLLSVAADLSTFTRTRHFAECVATVQGERVLLRAPITPEAMPLLLAAQRITHSAQGEISRVRILHNELAANQFMGPSCSVVIESLPCDAITLREACYTMSQRLLLNALCRFRSALRAHNICHNNLSLDNIMVFEDGELMAIRACYASTYNGADDAAFTLLEQHIRDNAFGDAPLPANSSSIKTREMPQLPLRDNRRRIYGDGGVGFCNEQGEVVIACQYLAASDFFEGRATVTDKQLRMGLIDVEGTEVIATLYDNVEYLHTSGHSLVCRDALWARFDYNGRQLSSWMPREQIDSIAEDEASEYVHA